MSEIENNIITAHVNVLKYCLFAYLQSLSSVRITPHILSVEVKKGAINIQRCSIVIENQKGGITVQSLW